MGSTYEVPRDAGVPDPVVHEFAPVARELLACDSRITFLSGSSAAALHTTIMDMLRSSSKTVLSMDVFDTFLLRNDKAETTRFYELSRLIQRRVVENMGDHRSTDEDVLLARLYAMELSYRSRRPVDGCREGHIRDIVRIQRRWLGWRDDYDDVMLDAEISYEVKNLHINPLLLDVARAFRERGGRVILVSDMYLGESEISSIIDRLDNSARDVIEMVCSSADCILSKRSGKIFRFIEEKLGAQPGEFIHIGDALDGDVYRCQDAGWTALHFPVSRRESTRRQESLQQFVAGMLDRGLDLTRWAKV